MFFRNANPFTFLMELLGTDMHVRANRNIRFLMELRRAGIHDVPLLSAIERLPREHFVPASFIDQAYENIALPIACGQTTSQPVLVAEMVQYLQLEKRHKVLEIGTGTGYQTALLAKLSRRVYTIDKYRELIQLAELSWRELSIPNITAIAGDGLADWQGQAPFDRIIVCAALPEIPHVLAEQLTDGGLLLAPVGREGQPQELIAWRRVAGGWIEEIVRPVRFVGCVSPLLTAMLDSEPLQQEEALRA